MRIDRHQRQGTWRGTAQKALVAGTMGVLLAGAPAYADEGPIDPALPPPTLLPHEDCGTADSPAWVSTRIPAPAGQTFSLTVPRPTVNGVTYTGVVHLQDLDDPTAQADGEVEGLNVPSQWVYVPLAPVDGHTYVWSAQTYDGADYSPATDSCYVTVDAGRPVVTSVTDPDYPMAGTGGSPRKSDGQSTTFTIESHDVLPAGCGAAGNPGCAVSGVRSFRWSLDTPLGVGGSGTSIGPDGEATLTLAPSWGPHTLYVQVLDGAGNIGESSYGFIVPWQLPAPAATTIRVNAPAKSTPTAQLAINGQVAPGSYVAGEVVHVSRTDPAHPKGTALPDAPLSADGHFAFTDVPHTVGSVVYRITFPGDQLQETATASATVHVVPFAAPPSLPRVPALKSPPAR